MDSAALDGLFDADFSSQHEHAVARDDLWCRVCGGGIVLGCGGDSAVSLCDQCGRASAAACSLQSSASRCRVGNRLPLLSHFGRNLQFCRHSAHQDLHELPLADLDQRPAIGAGARQLQVGRVAAVDAGEPASRTLSFSITAFTSTKGWGARPATVQSTRCRSCTNRSRCRWSGA